MKIFILLLTLVIPLSAYVRSPYQTIEPNAIQLRYAVVTESFDQNATRDPLHRLSCVFRLNDLFVGVHPQQLEIDGNMQRDTQYSVGWFVFDRFPMKWVNWSMQLGAYSLGATSENDSNGINGYLPNVALTHRFDLPNQPLFAIWSMYYNNSANVNSGFIVGVEDGGQQLYLDYDHAIRQLYVGADIQLFNRYSGSVAVNLSKNQSLTDAGVFYPSLKIGIGVDDLFSTKAQQKAVQPLPVDEEAYLLMERALLAFNAEDYTVAAKLYTQVLQRYPEFTLAYVRLGNSYYQLKQYALAKQAWTSALRLDPNNDAVFMALVKLNNRQIQTDDILNSSGI